MKQILIQNINSLIKRIKAKIYYLHASEIIFNCYFPS
jgi:hypothetical protein